MQQHCKVFTQLQRVQAYIKTICCVLICFENGTLWLDEDLLRMLSEVKVLRKREQASRRERGIFWKNYMATLDRNYAVLNIILLILFLTSFQHVGSSPFVPHTNVLSWNLSITVTTFSQKLCIIDGGILVRLLNHKKIHFFFSSSK